MVRAADECRLEDGRDVGDAGVAGSPARSVAEFRAAAPVGALTAQGLLALQHTAGNRAVGRLLARQQHEQRPPAGPSAQEATAKLIDDFEQAVAENDWDAAAATVDHLSYDDALLLLGELSYAKLQRLGAAMERTGHMGPSGVWADAVKAKAVSENAWTGKKMGTWGVSAPTDIIGAKRQTQIFDTFEGAVAFAQSLAQPAGIVEDGEEFAVYDLNAGLSSSFYPFSISNVRPAMCGCRAHRRTSRRWRACAPL